MSSAIPVAVSGALPSTSTRVENAHTPGPNFDVSCDYLALPSDCTARILPSQINAIVSELMSLAECFNPDGTWNCNSQTNMCTNFTTYRTDTTLNLANVSLFSDIQKLLCGVTQTPVTAGSFYLFCDGDGEIHKAAASGDICDAGIQTQAIATDFYVVCTAAGDLVRVPAVAADPGDCMATVAAICASVSCSTTLAQCLISADPNNNLIPGTDGLLLVPATPFLMATANPVQNFRANDPVETIEYITDLSRGAGITNNGAAGFTITEPGLWSIVGQGNGAQGNIDEILRIMVNGVQFAEARAGDATVENKSLNVHYAGFFNAGDVIEVEYALMVAGSNPVYQMQQFQRFSAVKIGN